MRIKTYYASTMGAALRDIKAELGEEALILSTKEVPCRSATGRQSSVEVVAAVDGHTDEFSNVNDRAEFSVEPPAASGTDPAELLRQAAETAYPPARPSVRPRPAARAAAVAGEGVRRQRKRESAPPPPAAAGVKDGAAFSDSITSALHRDLLASGVEEGLACKLLQIAREMRPAGRVRSRGALVGLLREAIGVETGVLNAAESLPGQRVVMFLGPAGVGKTTSIAKLAARLTLVNKKKVALMTADGFRIGAVEQLRTYARMIGVPFRFVNQTSDLAAAIREQSQRDYVLIDTGGFSPRDSDALRELAEFLRESTQIERHLVLSATTSPADNRAAVDRFSPCSPDYLLFTKLDEASQPGPILNELVRTRKPGSYYSNGQRVPQDLHAMNRDTILDILLQAN